MKMPSGVRFLSCRLLTPSPHTGRTVAYQPRRWNDLILADLVSSRFSRTRGSITTVIDSRTLSLVVPQTANAREAAIPTTVNRELGQYFIETAS